MTIAERNGMMTSDLPSGLVRVEYIANTWGSYLSIPIRISPESVIYIDGYVTENNKELFQAGPNNYIRLNCESGVFFYAWFSYTNSIPYQSTFSRHQYIFSTELYVDGVKLADKEVQYPWATPSPLYLLYGVHGVSQGALYSVRTQGAEPDVDIIPVRFTNERGVDEGAMYDMVSKQLFRNAGNGAFVIGPDVSSQMGGGGTLNA